MSRSETELYRWPPLRPSVLAGVLTRRRVLTGATATVVGSYSHAEAHEVGAVIPPIAVPQINVITSAGEHRSLRDLLAGYATAMQLMFTSCRSICPIEAATLSRVQDALGGYPRSDIRLLSLSIDPDNDTPEKLRSWLERFGARPVWTAAAPLVEDIPKVRILFDRRSYLGEDHSTAVGLIDGQARLVWRTSELPSPREVANALDSIADAKLPASE